MSNKFISSFYIFLICGFQLLTAQEATIINHSLDDFHSFPTNYNFAEDADGNIWVLQNGSFDGDYVLRYKDEVWERITFDDCGGHCTYKIIADNNGIIYLSTTDGFYAYENDAWIKKTGDIINNTKMAFDGQNNLWFSHEDNSGTLAFMSEGGGVTQIPSVSGLIKEIDVAPDNTVWFKLNNVVSSYNGNSLTVYDDIYGPVYLEIDGEGVVWVTEASGGLSSIVNGVVNSSPLNGVTNGMLLTSFNVDRNNNIMWFGEQGTDAGMRLYDGTSSILLDGQELFPDIVGLTSKAFVASDGTLWAGANFNILVAEIRPKIISGVSSIYTEVKLFPNPAKNNILVELATNKTDQIDYTIFNHLGQVVANGSTSVTSGKTSINVEHLNSGKFILRMPSERLQSSFIKK